MMEPSARTLAILSFVVAPLILASGGCSSERDAQTAPDNSQQAATAPDGGAALGAGRTFLVDCADASFTVHATPGQVELSTPQSLGGERIVLHAVPSGSGARYQEGETVFWDHGGSALVEVAGQRFTDCTLAQSAAP